LSLDDRRRVVELFRERDIINETIAKSSMLQKINLREENKSKLPAMTDLVKQCLEENRWPTPKVSRFAWRFRHSLRKWKKFFHKIFYRNGQVSLQLHYTLKIIPFVNAMNDLFFDQSVIGLESVKSLLDILGLLNALLLGVAVSILTAVSYDDAIAADERYGWGLDGIYWVGQPPSDNSMTNYVRAYYSWYQVPPSSIFLANISDSISLFFIGVLCVVYMYADMVSKMPDANDDALAKETKTDEQIIAADAGFEETSPPNISDLFQHWWNYSKYGILAVMFTTMLGCIFSTFAVQDICFIKYPNYYILHYGEFSFYDSFDPFGSLSTFFKLSAGVTGLIVVGGCGMGTSRRYSFEDDMKESAALRQSLKELKDKWETSNLDDEKLMILYISSLKQAFYFFMACEDILSARAVINSIKTSGLSGHGEIASFIAEISDSGDYYYGIREKLPERIDEEVKNRVSSKYYEKLMRKN